MLRKEAVYHACCSELKGYGKTSGLGAVYLAAFVRDRASSRSPVGIDAGQPTKWNDDLKTTLVDRWPNRALAEHETKYHRPVALKVQRSPSCQFHAACLANSPR